MFSHPPAGEAQMVAYFCPCDLQISSGLQNTMTMVIALFSSPGMIRILVYINSLISCLASPTLLEEVKIDRVWVLPPEKQLLMILSKA